MLFNQKGQSLIEVLGVSAIIAIVALAMAGVGITGFQSAKHIRLATDTQSVTQMAKIALTRSPSNATDRVCYRALVMKGTVPPTPISSYTGNAPVTNIDIYNPNQIDPTTQSGAVAKTALKGMRYNESNPSSNEADFTGVLKPTTKGPYPFRARNPSTGNFDNFNYYITELEITSRKAVNTPGGQLNRARIPIGIVTGPNGNQFFDCFTDPVESQSLCLLLGGKYDSTKTPQCLLSKLPVASGWAPALPPLAAGEVYTQGGMFTNDRYWVGNNVNALKTSAIWGLNNNVVGMLVGTTIAGMAVGSATTSPNDNVGMVFDYGVAAQRASVAYGFYGAGNPNTFYLRTYGNEAIVVNNMTGAVETKFVVVDPRPRTPPEAAGPGRVGIFVTTPQATLDVNGNAHFDNFIFSGDLTAGKAKAIFPDFVNTSGFIASYPAADYAIMIGQNTNVPGPQIPSNGFAFVGPPPGLGPPLRGVFVHSEKQGGLPNRYVGIETYQGGDIRFYTNTTQDPPLFLKGNPRRIGIGTTNPQVTLDIQGTAGNPQMGRGHFSNRVELGVTTNANLISGDFAKGTAIMSTYSGFQQSFLATSPASDKGVGMGFVNLGYAGFAFAKGNTRLGAISVMPPSAAQGVPRGYVGIGPADQNNGTTSISTSAGTPLKVVVTPAASRVGIGTTNPQSTLHVAGGNVRVDGTATSPAGCIVGNGTGPTCPSDERLKEKIRPLENSLEKLLQINAVEFQWKTKSSSSDPFYPGLIAQNVEKYFPLLVRQNSSDQYKRLNYEGLVAPLIEAVHNLYEKLQSLFQLLAETIRRTEQILSSQQHLLDEQKQLLEEIERLKELHTEASGRVVK